MPSKQKIKNENDEIKMSNAEQKEIFCDKIYKTFVNFCNENYRVKEKDLQIVDKRGINCF